MLKVFPATLTHDGRKVPVKDFNWKEDCSNDPEVIASWTTKYPQLKFYGVPTGPENDLLVLDVDVKGGGLETIKKYNIPLTNSQTTMSGGVHYLFKYPKDGNLYGNKVGFDNGLDIRGNNGYIINYAIDAAPIAESPEWLKQHAFTVTKEVVKLEDAVKIAPEIVQAILEKACDNIINAPEGESNEVLNVEAYNVGKLLTSDSIDRETAYNALFSAAKERGKEDYEAKATINSGLKGGSENPVISPFGNLEPVLTSPVIESTAPERWTPNFLTRYDLTNFQKLKKPQLFKDWSTEDIHITTADGGTGKTTMKLVEAVCLALGEDFLGFKCKAPGRTLFVTGEDTAEKLGAMLGMIITQMGYINNKEKVSKILGSILIKKENDMCMITKTKQGFIAVNHEAVQKVFEAIEDFKPKMIVFDPIASFWGSESMLNDMSKAVTKFLGVIVEKSNACVEVINHMGKSSSNDKDMSQFAGRGGTGLPSHARVSRALRPIFGEEFEELTGTSLTEKQSAIMCNVNKFSDGSPLYNKPFLIVREGYLFSKVTMTEREVVEKDTTSEAERIFTFIKRERNENKYPSKKVIIANVIEFMSKNKAEMAIANLEYNGYMGEKIKFIDSLDIDSKERVCIITDMEGEE
jgi:RecA-family ATPase